MNCKNILTSDVKKSFPQNILPTITLALLVIVSFTTLSYADYPSPLKQIESGVAPQDIQCNTGFVHVVRDNNNHACFTEKTAERVVERFGWQIIPNVSNITSEQPTIIELDTASTVEFVDDGREYPQAVQRAPAPVVMYDYIMSYDYNTNDIGSDNSLKIKSTPHEKYSLNPGVGFYVEDWIPTYIPDGQKLLFVDNHCHPDGFCYIKMQFVPTDFEFSKDITNHDIQNSKGFRVYASYIAEQRDEIEDKIEEKKEIHQSRLGNYGGFREMTYNGNPVYAFEGGDYKNIYRAAITFNIDEYRGYSVISHYHTLDEIIPVFKSIMN